MEFRRANARCRYIEITYLKDITSESEKRILIYIPHLNTALKKLDEIAPNRIITNIEVLCAIEML